MTECLYFVDRRREGKVVLAPSSGQLADSPKTVPVLHQCTITVQWPGPTCASPHTHCISPHTFTSHQARLPLFRHLHNDDNLGPTAPPGLMDIRIFYGRHQMEFLCRCQTDVKRDLAAARNPPLTS